MGNNRRSFFRLIISGLISSGLFIPFSRFLDSQNENSNEEFKLVFRCCTKRQDSSYANEIEFWNGHSDPIVRMLNREFFKRGWLKKLSSRMIDERTVEVTKIYAHKDYANLFDTLWDRLSSNSEKAEPKKVRYI